MDTTILLPVPQRDPDADVVIDACDAAPVERAPCCQFHAAEPDAGGECRRLFPADIIGARVVAKQILRHAPTGPFAELARAFLAISEVP